MLHFRNTALALLVTASLATAASASVVISDSDTLGTNKNEREQGADDEQARFIRLQDKQDKR